MKLSLLLSVLFFTLSSYAIQDGTYTCGSRANFFDITYKVKTLSVEGIDLPHLEITKNYYKKPTDPKSADKTYLIKGIANVFTNEDGVETLVLGNIAVELTAGRITCE